MFIAIDGDDVGRKITRCYLNNDKENLKKISEDLVLSMNNVADFLKDNGFSIIFCAADGVTASTESTIDFRELFKKIQVLSPNDITFSAGVGETLRDCYLSLLNAKSSGKNLLFQFSEF